MDMQNFPFPQTENTFESTMDEEELRRKELSYKRVTILLTVVAVILIAFIIWEIVDISLGGRP